MFGKEEKPHEDTHISFFFFFSFLVFKMYSFIFLDRILFCRPGRSQTHDTPVSPVGHYASVSLFVLSFFLLTGSHVAQTA